jgi:hypothetical protein
MLKHVVHLVPTLLARAVAQAVSRWLPTAAARVRVRPACEVCGGQSSTGAGFLRVLRFPLPIIIPPISRSSQSPGAGTIGHWWPQCRADPIGLHPLCFNLLITNNVTETARTESGLSFAPL